MTAFIIACVMSIGAWFAANGQSATVQAGATPTEKISVCALRRDPAAYNHTLIEVDGIVSHGFEDFTLSGPDCGQGLGIWLEYGGLVNSNTMYCCGSDPALGVTASWWLKASRFDSSAMQPSSGSTRG